MSSDFEVRVQSASPLTPTALSANLSVECEEIDIIPVLFGDEVYRFHDIEGGYDKESDEHVITLIHRVQGDGSPPDDPIAKSVEVHTGESFYNFSLNDITHWNQGYPDDDYALTLFVDKYQQGEYTFRDALLADIDGREQEFSYNE